ncbi:hypothetical protein KY317_00525 [Candidatus Woesearchaeota archaeon]|nr:hypothetical protein [Candidatus Woesearchaeota archaeon]
MKKCIVCGKKAEFGIKHSSEYYCEECALENFNDLELLEKIDEQIKALKELIKEEKQEHL